MITGLKEIYDTVSNCKLNIPPVEYYVEDAYEDMYFFNANNKWIMTIPKAVYKDIMAYGKRKIPMKINDFPYGKITKTLRKAVNWLNTNRRQLEKIKCQHSFDYPYYWDMPKLISHRLSGDEVDWLQAEVYDWKYKLTPDEYDDLITQEESNAKQTNNKTRYKQKSITSHRR